MVTYKHKIWLRNFNAFSESKWYANGVLIALALILFIMIWLFTSKVTATIESGIKAQARIDKIAEEVTNLEKENKKLKYDKGLYLSQEEIDAQYRTIEGKKKAGEKVLLVSFPNKVNEQSNDANIEKFLEPTPTPPPPNWEKWISKIF